MSNCTIHNIARVIDVRQIIDVGSRHASNERIPTFENTAKESSTVLRSQSVNAPKGSIGVKDESAVVGSMVALFTSFFTQLLSLLSGLKDSTVPDVPVPKPPLKVTPQVVPDPVVPLPTPAATIPGLSSKRNSTKPDNIWSGFRQGPDGNCVTVSAIKAAMYRFGQSPTDIYKQVTKVNDGYRVVMRDDFQLTLTDRELIDGARGAQFHGQDKGMLKDAQFLFAVSAKRAQMENNDRTAGKSYQAAIRSLNNGEDESGPGEGFLRLGLRKHMKRVSVRDLAGGQLGMCNRAGHSVAVINGREEKWGRQGSAPTHGHAVALV